MSKGQSIPPTQFEAADSDSLSEIVSLNQNLRELQMELASKLASLDASSDADEKLQKKHLATLAEEVERALLGIDEVVNMVATEEC